LDLIGIVQIQASPDGSQELVMRMLLGNFTASDCISWKEMTLWAGYGSGRAYAKYSEENNCGFVLHDDVG
jgi:hypothetical protein